MRFNTDGLTEADLVIRDRIIAKLNCTPHEKGSVTKSLANWHKGWSKMVNSSQTMFNKMRRLQCADDYGICTCCCTGKRFRFDEIDAGHFISATKQATRFNPSNVHPQSKHSNNHNLGDDAKIDYTMFMMERYGRDYIDALRKKSRQSFSWRDNKEELLALRIVWSRNIKDQKERLGI